jgi:histidinol-phosphate aminotransferase
MLAGPFANLGMPSFSRRMAVPGNDVLRLDLNENAYGPSPEAVAAIQGHALSANRFPRGEEQLRESLSEHLDVPADQILLGSGIDEILRMSAAAFLGPNRKLVMAAPSYEVITRYASALGSEVVSVPLRKDHGHDLDAMLARVDGKTGAIYICNPNNPTGTLSDRKRLEKFIQTVPEPVLLIVDEAYHEYVGSSNAYTSMIHYRTQRENLIVARTFSKVYGLAGARLGLAVGRLAVLERLAARRALSGINEFALVAGAAAVRDKTHTERCVRQNQDDRQEFINQVNARMLRALDSHTNFVCLNVMGPSKEIIGHFRKNNVILPGEIPEMPNYLRVSLGLAEEMAEFWRIWDLLGSHPMAM